MSSTAVLAKVDALKGTLIPADVGVAVTRDYGATASEKSNELLLHMGLAVFGVAVLILLFLGWRESLVVLLAIPVTLGLTLLVFYLYGYTLNRITLFALIFSIGILVDDAIVVVENIVRHMGLPSCRRKRLLQIAVEAVDEVGNPTILATWAVIAAVLPMAFVSGLMGPYMRPIPIGSSAAMLFSLLVAFAVTPWAALKVLRGHARHAGHAAEFVDAPAHRGGGGRGRGDARHLLHAALPARDAAAARRTARWRWAFLAVVAGLTAGAMGLVGIGAVKVKMLPFDNKSEFQVILNMPKGSTLEQTARGRPRDGRRRAHRARGARLPGLRRHGLAVQFQRPGAPLFPAPRRRRRRPPGQPAAQGRAPRAEPRHRQARPAAARRHRGKIRRGRRRGRGAARPAGAPDARRRDLRPDRGGAAQARRQGARDLPRDRRASSTSTGMSRREQPKTIFHVDKAKAALHGITEAAIARTVQMAVQGYPVTLLHAPGEREDVDVVLELPRALRARPDDLLALPVRSEIESAGAARAAARARHRRADAGRAEHLPQEPAERDLRHRRRGRRRSKARSTPS